MHINTPALIDSLQRCRTEIRRFHSNCTSLVQPLYQVLPSSLRAEWKNRCDAKQNELVHAGQYTNSGRVVNRGKYFYFKHVKDFADELNIRSIGGCRIASESLTKCRLISITSGTWTIPQLTEELQAIVQNYRDYFNGKEPSTE